MRNVKTLFTFACRIVSGAKKHDHLTLLLKNLSWLPVKDQLNYRQSFMAFECMTAVTPLNTLRPNLLPVRKLANEVETTRSSQKR